MYRYIDPSEDSFLQNDKIYQKIVKLLDPFTSNLNSEEDRQLIFRMISNCYHKYHKSILTRSRSDIELLVSVVMSILIEQSSEIERLGSLRSASP
jgi:hypothetical protein